MSAALARAKTRIETRYGTHRGWVRYLLGQIEGAVGPRERFRALRPTTVERLVFVCLGNVNRSAFAHAVAAGTAAECASIGLSTTTGAPATPEAIAVAREFGVSLDAHQATDYSDYTRRDGDLLLVMELRHAHALVERGVPPDRIALLGHWAKPVRYHIHDPHTLSTGYYRTCFALIRPAVLRLVEELERAGSPGIRR